jgi:hypothetical protein
LVFIQNIRTFELRSKVLSLEKTKKMVFFLVFCSLIRTFELSRRYFRSKKQKKWYFSWFFARLFVPLQPHFGKSEASDDVNRLVIRPDARLKDVLANNI